MSNPLFNQLGGNVQNSNVEQMMQQFKQFRKNLTGNPKDMVMNMLSSGQITQQQLNQAQNMANQLKHFIK